MRLRDQDGYASDILAQFLQPRGTVLEVGCGQGRNLIYLANLGLKVVGVDINEDCVRKVASATITALQADASNLPFQDNSFDHILCTEVLEHLADPDTCLSECYRVLKGNGTALFTCPTLNIPLRMLVPFYRKLAHIPQHSYGDHLSVFSAKQVISLLGKRFEIVEVKYVEFLTILERRFNIGYGLEEGLSSFAYKLNLLRYLAGGGWFKVRKLPNSP